MQNNFIKIYILICSCLQFNTAFAQQNFVLNLNKAFELGMASSKYLKLDSAKLIELNEAVIDAKDKQLPSGKVSANAMQLANASLHFKATPPSSFSNFPKINQVLMMGTNFSQTIYAGGRIKYSIEAANNLLKAAQFNAGQNVNVIKLNIIQSYTNLFKAQQIIKIFQDNLTASQKRDSIFLRLENNGLLARNDRLKAQLQSSTIELQLLEAISNYKVAEAIMNITLGLDEQTSLITDSTFIQFLPENEVLSYFENEAIKNRKDIQALQFQTKAQETQVKIIKAESLPVLAISGGYTILDVPKFVSITNLANIGLAFQFPIDHFWKSKAKLNQANSKIQQLNYTTEIAKDNIKINIHKDYENALLAKYKIKVFQKAVDQATENFRIVKNKYDNSLVNISDLLEADAALLSTKLNILNAKADATLAYKKLLLTSGISF